MCQVIVAGITGHQFHKGELLITVEFSQSLVVVPGELVVSPEDRNGLDHLSELGQKLYNHLVESVDVRSLVFGCVIYTVSVVFSKKVAVQDAFQQIQQAINGTIDDMACYHPEEVQSLAA